MGLYLRLAAAAVAVMTYTGPGVMPALTQTIAPETTAKPDTSESTHANLPNAQSRGIASKAIEAARSAARSAGDILTRVPCLQTRGVKETAGSLPRVARRIAAGDPVTIVAFGSSTTVGYGTSSPAYNYPSRLADQLRRKFPTSDITIINRGMGGTDTPEMMKRFQVAVLADNPDLVIWQLGTNTVVKGTAADVTATAGLLEDGIAQLQAHGIDVVLVDPQYVPAVTAKAENATSMVKLLGRVGQLKNVAVFPRFEIMKQWHEDEKLPFDAFVIGDGLHMNDWGYACFAQLLGDMVIKSVGQVQAGIDIPTNVMKLRPM